MGAETFLDGRVTVHVGDCCEVLPGLAEASVESVVCDPPYHLKFMGQAWDRGDVAFRPDTWRAVLRVLKPGGHALIFGGTRTKHRMAVAIEDAGFEIRDEIAWIFGSGFPKSHNVAKAIDRAAGVEPTVIGTVKQRDIRNGPGRQRGSGINAGERAGPEYVEHPVTSPTTPEAAAWEGWGTALKPAFEGIIVARKPLSEGSIAANVQQHGTGALNVDVCRVEGTDNRTFAVRHKGDRSRDQYRTGTVHGSVATDLGRWPANVVHDGSDEVLAAFPDAPGQFADESRAEGSKTNRVYGPMSRGSAEVSAARAYADAGGTNFAMLPGVRRADAGSAARFFYSAKADVDDRLGSKHPTVKPLRLMQWLVRLVTPPDGTVLDPFAGTGTTGEAAWREGFRAVLIEREPEYVEDIRRRMALATEGRRSRRAAAAARHPTGTELPLFAGSLENAAPGRTEDAG